jgi:hypothetical protein
MIIARKKNDNVILWDPVSAEGAFTSIKSFVHVYQQYAPEPVSSSAFTNDSGAVPVLPHDKMLKAAQRLVPDDAWYEEDFTNLRHPGR